MTSEAAERTFKTRIDPVTGKVTPEYTAWRNMRGRCSSPTHPDYPDYGARGIKVCAEWDSFEQFLADVGPRPAPHLTLDRIDNSRGYEPGNVRWTTRKAQQRNRRSTRFVTAFGETHCLSEWEERTGLPVRHRLDRGWSPEDAVTKPIGTYLQFKGRPPKPKPKPSKARTAKPKKTPAELPADELAIRRALNARRTESLRIAALRKAYDGSALTRRVARHVIDGDMPAAIAAAGGAS